ncbi:perilipin-2-like [Megalops cyprinoides]|uniref:perilipin-2-like n=1 Tax=Megalops cyprinoides TaxID=118141 RepID=UPI0018643DAE|nr:perilipin-2-like [Megalops cyprinoides]
METREVESSKSVVARLASLQLISSTCDVVSSVYCSTKDRHPYISSMCEVAEVRMKTFTTVAATRATPIINKLKPQIAVANELACKGLDKIEATLPILHQPSEQIVPSAMDVVNGAKEVVAITLNGAMDTAWYTLVGAMGRTKGVLLDSVETTKAVVSCGISSVMSSRMAQLVSSGVDSVLSTSEMLVDRYLPLAQDELEKEVKTVKGFDTAIKPSYSIRLDSLSAKLQQRAYQQAVAKVQKAKACSQESMSQLHHTVDLIEYARQNMGDANRKLLGMQEKLSWWVEWKCSGHAGEEGEDQVNHMESYILATARKLTCQVQTTCLSLVPSLQGLPQSIQHQALSVALSASEIYNNFSRASSFRDVSDSTLAGSRGQLGRMKESLDSVMDYLVNNTPLNWLVGSFYPRKAHSPAPPKAPVQRAGEDAAYRRGSSAAGLPIVTEQLSVR